MDKALVGVVMGSTSDWDVMQHAARQLKDFGVSYNALLETGGVAVGENVKIEVEAELVAQDATQDASPVAGAAGWA